MVQETMEQIKNEYLTKRTWLRELAKKYGVPQRKISSYLKGQGIELKQGTNSTVLEKYKDVYEEYKTSNLNIAALATRIGCTRQHLGSVFRKFQEEEGKSIVEKDKYQVDNSFFEFIDNEEKAYWLGFLMADGYNSNTYLQLSISAYDFNHVRKFRKSLSSTHKIRYKHQDNTVSITISDKKLTEDLSNKGCIKGKTTQYATSGRWALPRHLLRHYIRGFFDGDGTINNIVHQELTSANSILRKIDKVSFTIKLESFADDIIEDVGIVTGLEFSKYYYEPLDRYEVYLQGQSNIDKFFSFIYKDASIYLDRKYATYLRYILPSDLEIEQIISAKLSGNILPELAHDGDIPELFIGQSEPKAHQLDAESIEI